MYAVYESVYCCTYLYAVDPVEFCRICMFTFMNLCGSFQCRPTYETLSASHGVSFRGADFFFSQDRHSRSARAAVRSFLQVMRKKVPQNCCVGMMQIHVRVRNGILRSTKEKERQEKEEEMPDSTLACKGSSN